MARTHSKKRKAAPKKPKTAPKKRKATPNETKAGARKRTKASKPAPAAAVGVGPHGESRKGREPVPRVAPASVAAPSRTLRGTQPARAALSVPSIKDEVNQVLSAVSPRPPDPIAACMSLEFELRLTDDIKRGLSNSFQRIARKSKPDARISDDECGDLDVVEDAWVLVTEKSGLSLDKECE